MLSYLLSFSAIKSWNLEILIPHAWFKYIYRDLFDTGKVYSAYNDFEIKFHLNII